MKTLDHFLNRIGLPAALRSIILSVLYGLMFLAALWAMGCEQGRFKYMDW